MKRDPRTIIDEIARLLDELATLIGDSSKEHTKKKSIARVKTTRAPRGVMGAIFMLIEEGFLDTPKEVSSIMNRLKEIGHYHKLQTVSMNLLNLTKRRTVNRFKNKKTKTWEYVLRR